MSKWLDKLCGIETRKMGLSEKFYYISLYLFMCYAELRTFLSNYIGHAATILFIVTYGLFMLSFFCDKRRSINSRKLTALLIIVSFLISYFCLTFLIHPEYSDVLFGPFTIYDYIIFPMSAFWTVFFFSYDADNQLLIKTLFVIAITRWILLIHEARDVIHSGMWRVMEPTLSGNLVEVYHTYNINWAYKLFATNVLFMVMYFRSKKTVLLIPTIIGQILILFFGSRGAFFMFFVFLIMCVLFCSRDHRVGGGVSFLILMSIITIVFLASGEATKLFMKLLNKTNVTSRTLRMLLNGEIMADSGRSVIYNKAIDMIKDVHFFGYGIYGDRHHILKVGRIAVNGYGYVHNVFLEILITYGVFGIIVLYIGTKRIIKEIVYEPDFDLKCIFLICVGCCLNLIFSSSYWYQYYFWALIGLMVREFSYRPYMQIDTINWR